MPTLPGASTPSSSSTPAMRATKAAHELHVRHSALEAEPAAAAVLNEEARVLRHARYNRLRRLAQDEGLSVHKVMTGRAVPNQFRSILDRAGRIVPDPIDFHTPQL